MATVFSPISIGTLNIKNRFMMAPMENGLAHFGGEVSERLINFYTDRTQKGVGIIITGSISVSPEGSGLPTQLAIFDEKFFPGLKKLCTAVHKAGGKIGAQLYHAGRQASEAITGIPPIAPSALPCEILSNHPREMNEKDLQETKENFVLAAKRAVEVGFDLIEVHFAHGYLLHSFFSPHSNHRTDAYGGSFENRCLYPMEVLSAMISEVKGKIPITIRISADEYLADGLGFEEVIKICKLSESAGVAAVSLTAGSYDSIAYCIQPMFIPQGFLIPFAQKLKEEISIPVIVAARLNNARLIEDIVQNGQADMVAIGRGLIADEDLILKIKEKRVDDIKYCVACNQGCIDNVLKGQGINCLVNGRSSYESERNILKTAASKNILIIGGGPAGLESARVAALAGHHVTLIEKSSDLGSKFTILSAPPEKESFLLYKNYLLTQIEKLKITVVQAEITSASQLAQYNPDYVILATGASQTKPSIPGIEAKNVVLAEDVLSGRVHIQDTVAIIGGGLVGIETAKYLASQGKKISVIEIADSIANDFGATYIGHIFAMLSEYGISVYTNAKIIEITPSEVKTENETIPAQSVVIAAGYHPNNQLANEVKTAYKNLIIVGDANTPRRIVDATQEAYVATYAL